MKRELFLSAALLALAACASTQGGHGDGGYTYGTHVDKKSKVRVDAPKNWKLEADSSGQMLAVRSPGGRVVFEIMRSTVKTSAKEMLGGMMAGMALENLSGELKMTPTERKIAGRRVKGFVADEKKTRGQIYTIDHGGLTYVVILILTSEATAKEREAGEYMLDRLRFVDGK